MRYQLNATTRCRARGLVLALAIATLLPAAAAGEAGQVPDLPERLADTGLYRDIAQREIAPGVLSYSPQYPLWTDGAAKRRWIYLPAGATIDASDPDAWVFPVGTKVWKEFAFGRPVETRYMERLADGSWAYATYQWSEDGSGATLAPELGVRGAVEIRPGVRHDLPSRYHCKACHEGQPTPVLGFSALQLSPDRDPLAPHADRPRPGDVDLGELVRRGLLRGLPAELARTPPRIEAATPVERAALGYLHGNCGHCHNPRGPLAMLGMSLAVRLASAHGSAPDAIVTTFGQRSRFALPGAAPEQESVRVAAGDPARSVLVARLGSRSPIAQMPPLGTHLVDAEALALIETWIRESRAAEAPRLAGNLNPVSPSIKERNR